MGGRGLFVKTHIPGLDEVIPGFPEGGLILVSGPPGSGKTILGMSYIYYGAVNAREPGLYVSVFESRERFLGLAGGLGLDFEKLMGEGLVEHLQLPIILEAGGAAAVNMIIDRVESLGARRLVIDSFTAIKEVFRDPGEARSLLQNIVSRILGQLKCTTILIKEGEASRGFEEYVADALIDLERTFFEDKLLRIMRIEKLRGAELRNPRVCFTIQKGLRVLPPSRLMSFAEAPSPDEVRRALPPSPPGCYTTGMPDLDREIGGYPKGSTILLEVDPKLTLRECISLVAPTAASYLNEGGYIMIIPCGGATLKDIEGLYKPYGAGRPELLQELMERINLLVEPSPIEERGPNVIEVEPGEGAVKKVTDIVDRLSKKFGRHPIWVIGVDRVARVFGERGIDLLYAAKEHVRRLESLMILILRVPEERLLRAVAPIADIHMRATRRHGCILLYGVKPRTPLYAVQPDPSGRTPIPSIIPIV